MYTVGAGTPNTNGFCLHEAQHMDAIYIFIKRNDIIIYIVAGLALFWYLSELLRAQRMLRMAVFGLEKERGTQLRNTALLFIILLSTVLSGVAYVSTQIIPTLPESLFLPPTATPDIFRTPPPTGAPLDTAVPTPTPPLVPTITLPGNAPPPLPADPDQETAAAPTAANAPIVIPTPIVDCNVLLNFNQPRNGSVASGTVLFNGTANLNNFGFYRIEANGPQTGGQWASLARSGHQSTGGGRVPRRGEPDTMGKRPLSDPPHRQQQRPIGHSTMRDPDHSGKLIAQFSTAH
jgi:hypothetical protein